MKFLLITFALIGIAAAAVLDSATQGPNPQDIATPEPEYIDIDLPEPPKSAPAPVAQRTFAAPAPVPQRSFAAPRPIQRPVSQATYSAPIVQHFQQQAPQQQFTQQLPGHAFTSQVGYQYRRPVYFRRTYRQRY